MKKSMIAVIIGTAGVLAATAAISAAAITANNNKNDDTKEAPVSEVSQAAESSAPGELALPEDKETIRAEIKKELSDKRAQLCSEMMTDGKEHESITRDAEEQVGIWQINEAAAIAKKYKMLDDDFTFADIIENAECMRAAVDLLNSSESITLRERVFLEIYLEDNYSALEWVEGAEKLAQDIENTVQIPYGRSIIDDMKKNAHLAADHISRPYQEKS